ncbi:SRPBCC family protein [Novosphingobium sp.]|uniref:aromatic ring-hydroxylating oxygenase subunit alpha n=1 Tax=Novosphingobium sp. TaxID=1874826 RepID=UPI0033401226
MQQFDTIALMLKKNRAGYTLPRELYVGEEAYRFDTEVMLRSVWLFAGTVAHAKAPGDWFVFELGNNQVIIVRGRDNQIRAFYNSCRHRGARVCEAASGNSPRLICPYHAWTYGLDGKLLAARNMPDGFDKADHGLVPVALENVGGLLFVCLADNPPPFGRAKQDIAEQIAIYNLDKLKVAVQDDLIEPANWKLVMENNRECYHCDQNHPELLKSLSTYGFGKGLPEDGADDVVDDAAFDAMLAAQRQHWMDLGIFHELVEFPEENGQTGFHRVARLPLANGAVSQTLDGKSASRMAIWPHGLDEQSSLSVWTQPNSWHHFCNDHVVTFSLTPLGPDKTLLRTSWLVHEDAVEGVDYDPAHLTAVWRATNAQDSYLSAVNHRGITSDGYRQGPYSVEEKLVDAFKTFYVDASARALG